MRRKIEQALTRWRKKETGARKPLIVNGARQVGKTYSILHFGESEFRDVVHLDFTEQPALKAIFDDDIQPHRIVSLLEASTQRRIDPEGTLVFLDEIQACPRALTSLKYFYERAPQYHVVAAGSLLGVSLGRKSESFPVGKVEELHMYPMDFEEFLWALGNEGMAALVRESFRDNERFALHQVALDIYDQYLLVGGMPEVVSAHAAGASLSEAREIQNTLLSGYVADMTRYATAGESAHILSVWRAIPSQLAKENHKFQYSTIGSSARAHQYEYAIEWLSKAGLVNYCFRVNEGVHPLKAHIEHDFFKLYLLDTGLLANLQGVGSNDLLPSVGIDVRFIGGLTETYVMQQLVANGVTPFYWGTSSKAEVDFIVQAEDGAVIPIEVKSGDNVTARSLMSYRKKYNPPYLVRISRKNFGFENGIRSVPLYAAFCLIELK